MPAELDRCVRSIKGTNKRTGKPYTESEKFAICNAQLKKNKKASFEEEIVIDSDIYEEVEAAMDECVRKMLKSGKSMSRDQAIAKCEEMMAKSNFDPKQLWFVFSKEL